MVDYETDNCFCFKELKVVMKNGNSKNILVFKKLPIKAFFSVMSLRYSCAAFEFPVMAASSSGEGSSSKYVCLSHDPLRFHPVSRENSVFFDEANKQVGVRTLPLEIMQN